jgi:hypothetical protein
MAQLATLPPGDAAGETASPPRLPPPLPPWSALPTPVEAEPLSPPAHPNYLIRHWRGDLSLPVTYWVNGLLGTLLVFAATGALTSQQETMDAETGAVLAICLYFAALAISVWQLIGVWRSSSKHVSRGGESGWAVLAKIVVVIAAIRVGTMVVFSYVPQTAELARMIGGDRHLPPYQIRALRDGEELEFRGGLRSGCARDLESALAKYSQAKVLHIESQGGRVAEARRMIKIVRRRELTTYTAEYCISAATLVLMSGKERVVAKGARIGFHAGSLPGATRAQQVEMDQLLRNTMRPAGVTETFINRVLATPGTNLWFPSIEEMRLNGVISSESFGDRFANSWGHSESKTAAALRGLGGAPLFRTIREVEPATYAAITNSFLAAIKTGKSEADAIATTTELGTGIMVKYLPSASDEALCAMRSQWVDILVKYKDRNSLACIGVFTQAKMSYSRMFPDWDMTNTLLVAEQVIRSGASRVKVTVDRAAAADDLTSVLVPLRLEYGNDLELLDHPEKWPAASQKACDLILAFYQEIERLPDKREANLLRMLLFDRQ